MEGDGVWSGLPRLHLLPKPDLLSQKGEVRLVCDQSQHDLQEGQNSRSSGRTKGTLWRYKVFNKGTEAIEFSTFEAGTINSCTCINIV